LREDVLKIYDNLEDSMRHCVTFFSNRRLNRSRIRIECGDTVTTQRSKDKLRNITLDNFTFIDSDRAELELTNISIDTDELKTIWTLVTRHDIHRIMTLNRTYPNHTLLNRIANMRPLRDTDTIDKLRSLRYPLGKIIQYARRLRLFSDSFKLRGYNVDLFMGDYASILSMELLSLPHIGVKHRSDIHQLISSLHSMGINVGLVYQAVEEEYIESIVSWSGKGTNKTMNDVESMLRDVRRMIQMHMSFSLLMR
jgi:hypothetical protein